MRFLHVIGTVACLFVGGYAIYTLSRPKARASADEFSSKLPFDDFLQSAVIKKATRGWELTRHFLGTKAVADAFFKQANQTQSGNEEALLRLQLEGYSDYMNWIEEDFRKLYPVPENTRLFYEDFIAVLGNMGIYCRIQPEDMSICIDTMSYDSLGPPIKA